MKKKISITINEKTLDDIDSIVDHIYVRNRSQAIEMLVTTALGNKKTAVILSGGDEDQLKIGNQYCLTSSIKGTTFIELILRKFKQEGFSTVYLIARKPIITAVFDIVQNGSSYGVSLQYVEESNSTGTAQSLALLKGKISTSFLVVYGDVFFESMQLEELWNEHIKRKGMTTLLLTTTPTPSKKGVVHIEGAQIKEFVQKPKHSDVYLGFSSIFVSQPEIFEYAGESLEHDVFPIMAKKGLLSGYLSTSKIIKLNTVNDIKMAAQHL